MSWWKSLAKVIVEQAVAWGLKKAQEKPRPIKRPKRNRA